MGVDGLWIVVDGSFDERDDVQLGHRVGLVPHALSCLCESSHSYFLLASLIAHIGRTPSSSHVCPGVVHAWSMMIGLTHLLLLTLTHALELDMENTRADAPVSLSNARIRASSHARVTITTSP
jgi:hypothetical protein